MTFKWPRLCSRARQAARATISPPVAFSPLKGEEGVCMSRSKSRLLALVASLLMLAVVSPAVGGASAAPQSSSDLVGVVVGFIQDNTVDYGVSATDVSDLDNASGSADTDAVEAVEAAAEELDLGDTGDLEVESAARGAAQRTVVSGGNISEDSIPVRLGWQPTKSGLRLAWQLEIDDASDIHYWNATVDAETGKLLDVDNWTIEDKHEDLAATVHGGKLPAASAQSSYPPARGFSLNPVLDGSCYRVFDLTLESPNAGDRRFVCNPADATGSPFGWHDTDGVSGAEFTITRGNNF